jgi:dimethylargininase
VEDTAVIIEEAAIIMRPGAASRLGEEVEISNILTQYKKIEKIDFPGTVDGGDIMRAEDHFFIGRSKRTNTEGAAQLASILSKYGYTSSEIKVEGVPHLKSGVTYIGNGNFVSIDEFSEVFRGYNVIRVEKEESYSSNCLLVNDVLLISRGYPHTRKKVIELGCKVIELEMSEFRKMDGALTCLSLIF